MATDDGRRRFRAITVLLVGLCLAIGPAASHAASASRRGAGASVDLRLPTPHTPAVVRGVETRHRLGLPGWRGTSVLSLAMAALALAFLVGERATSGAVREWWRFDRRRRGPPVIA